MYLATLALAALMVLGWLDVFELADLDVFGNVLLLIGAIGVIRTLSKARTPSASSEDTRGEH
jgi:uncharacterized membrane protein YqjE